MPRISRAGHLAELKPVGPVTDRTDRICFRMNKISTGSGYHSERCEPFQEEYLLVGNAVLLAEFGVVHEFLPDIATAKPFCYAEDRVSHLQNPSANSRLGADAAGKEPEKSFDA